MVAAVVPRIELMAYTAFHFATRHACASCECGVYIQTFHNVTVQRHLNAIATTTCTALHISECILHVHMYLLIGLH